jgi:26S proteasome regulatory subunit T3
MISNDLDKVADTYTQLKLKERRLQFLEIQEEYIKDEVKNLKREILRAQEEVC